MSNAEHTTTATAEATSKVSPDMPHVEATATAGGAGDIPHDREPSDIRKENNTMKYVKAAIIIALAIAIIIAGFLLGKRLFGNRAVIIADEVVSAFSMSDIGNWFKKTGSTIVSSTSKAFAWFKGLFSRTPATAAADAATAAA